MLNTLDVNEGTRSFCKPLHPPEVFYWLQILFPENLSLCQALQQTETYEGKFSHVKITPIKLWINISHGDLDDHSYKLRSKKIYVIPVAKNNITSG